VEPLRKLSGAKTAKMGAETSDAMLKILITSLKKKGKLGVGNCPMRRPMTMR
jgi:hypothetical protein